MTRWYVTFGQGTNRRDRYAVVEADSWGDAHDRVVAIRGKAWAFLYSEGEFAGQAEQYGLTEVRLDGDAAVIVR